MGHAQEEDPEMEAPKKAFRGKIRDDSTKQIYSHKTTKFIFEKDITDNQGNYRSLDTAVFNIEYFTEVDKRDKTFQDLGNNGTALRNIYFQSEESIGIQSGFTSYEPYFVGPYNIKYYDTKSPFTDMSIILGGKGRAHTEVNFSRNISPTWNFGFDYRSIVSDKQYQRSSKGDRQVTGVQYDFYSLYKSKNEKFLTFFNFSRNKHTVLENGGINVEIENGINDFFDENAETFLKTAQSQELRRQIHLYQEYNPKPILGGYYSIDWDVADNSFSADLTSGDEDYLPGYNLDSTATNDKFTFQTFTAQTGVKGQARFANYNFYYKYRQVKGTAQEVHSADSTVRNFGENYLGGTIRMDIDSSFYLKGLAELELSGNYKLEAMSSRNRLQAGFKLIQSPAAMIQQSYYGNHDNWVNNFDPIKVQEIWGSFGFNFGRHSFRPFGKIINATNHIYYGLDKTPQQYKSAAQITTFGYDYNIFFFKKLGLSQTLIYASVDQNAQDIFNIPKWLINTKVYYHNQLFKKNLEIMVGVDTHWKSEYNAYSYNPTTQQFHLTDNNPILDYLNVDVFLNARIGKARLFVKYINLTQALTGKGYFSTPLYPGQHNTVDFGVFWAFYD